MQTSMRLRRFFESFSSWRVTHTATIELTTNSRKPLIFQEKGGLRRRQDTNSLVPMHLQSRKQVRVQVQCKCIHNHSHSHSHSYSYHYRKTQQQELGPGAEALMPPKWIPADAWNGFVEMRKKTKAPLTHRAITLDRK